MLFVIFLYFRLSTHTHTHRNAFIFFPFFYVIYIYTVLLTLMIGKGRNRMSKIALTNEIEKEKRNLFLLRDCFFFNFKIRFNNKQQRTNLRHTLNFECCFLWCSLFLSIYLMFVLVINSKKLFCSQHSLISRLFFYHRYW